MATTDKPLYDAMADGLGRTEDQFSRLGLKGWRVAMVAYNPANRNEFLVIGSAGDEPFQKEIGKLVNPDWRAPGEYTEPLTIEKLVERLRQFDRESPVRFDAGFVPGRFDSYRGDYAQVALGNENPELHSCSVGELILKCQGVVGSKFEGYKGGIYTMSSQTSVYAANWGFCGPAIVAVRRGEKDEAILVTQEID